MGARAAAVPNTLILDIAPYLGWPASVRALPE
jgi:hypothetical protein